MFPFPPYLIQTTLAEASESGTGWLPVMVSLITAVLTVGASFYVSRGKQKTTDFEVIIDERKEFTDEIRKELKRKEAEYEKELAESAVEIKRLRDILVEKDATILRLRSKIEESSRGNGSVDSP